jgi:GTP-binding protein YchF
MPSLHVLRCFEDGDVTHVEGSVDPVRDAEIIVSTELMLSDLESLEKQVEGLKKRAKLADKESVAKLPVVELAIAALSAGNPARTIIEKLSPDQYPIFEQMQLLTGKPVLYVCNVDEASAQTGNAHTAQVAAMAEKEHASFVIISASIEAEISQLSSDEQAEFLATLGLEEPGLNKVIRAGYGLLGLLTFFTVGPKEARAWTVHKGAKAPNAAGAIHTDFERGFIRAETIAYQDYVSLGGESAARDAGKLRQEGKEYIVQDGDVFHFKFNV